MKKMLFGLLAVGVIAFAGSRPASAQSETAVVKIPFQFIVGEHLLPAGSYRITPDTEDPLVLLVTGIDNKAAAAFAGTQWTKNPYVMDTHAHVAFKSIDGQHFLWQVAVPGVEAREVVVTKATAERTLAKLNLMPAERADGARWDYVV